MGRLATISCPKEDGDDDYDDAAADDDDHDVDDDEEEEEEEEERMDGMRPFPYDQRGILTKHGRDSIRLKLEIPRHKRDEVQFQSVGMVWGWHAMVICGMGRSKGSLAVFFVCLFVLELRW